MLEDVTPSTHVFKASGLFKKIMVEVSENATVTPMRVYVAPEETRHARSARHT